MIIDISQEVLSSKVFPGDPVPMTEKIKSIKNSDICNLTTISMCAHNGTHMDAPFHFIDEGKTIDQIAPEVFVGDCYVMRHDGDVSAEDAQRIMELAKAAGADRRILISGKATVTEEAAEVFAQEQILLIGNESQTVGPESSPVKVHMILLGAGVVLLEGLVLDKVPDGKYLLSAAPLNFKGSDGSPCRAVLIS